MSAPAIPSAIEPLLGKPVAVLGLGVSGRAVVDLLARLNIACICYDEREGEEVRRDFTAASGREHDLVVASPGFDFQHPWLQAARAAGCRLMGELELAAFFWTGKIIAITGTNGKTTLTEFLTFALKRAGRHAVAVGNVGLPLARVSATHEYEGATAVCEISSFQAETLSAFPIDSLIWINFFENHLDRHGSMETYFRAKWNLVERMRGDAFVAGVSVANAASEFACPLPPNTMVVDPVSVPFWEVPDTSAFASRRQAENLALARRWWQNEGLPEESLRSAAKEFGVREHRMKRLHPVGNVTFWNDSKATNFAACLGALDNFERPVIWVGGGKYRGGDIEAFARAVASRVKEAFLIGESAHMLSSYLESAGIPVHLFPTLQEAVRAAHAAAAPGDQVLFSPGFSSQDSFTSYIERGSCFENAVFGLKGSPLEG